MAIYTYKIYLRRDEKTLEIFEDFCEAASSKEATDIFTVRHGRGKTVAGPFKVDPVTKQRI